MGEIGTPLEEWDVPEPVEIPTHVPDDEPVPAGR